MTKRTIFWDTETVPFRPGAMAPEMVCLSYQVDKNAPKLLTREDGIREYKSWLRDPNTTIVAHNAQFDLAVMCAADPEIVGLTFKALDENRVTCTKLRQQLIDISKGQLRGYQKGDKWVAHNYSLADLARRHLNMHLSKEDNWRMLYGHFVGVPLDRWLEHAKNVRPDLPAQDVIDYPLLDARVCSDVYYAQNYGREVTDEFSQMRAYFALQMASVWGMRTSVGDVDQLEEHVGHAYEELRDRLKEQGLVRANGTRDTKAAAKRMEEVMGRNVIRTEAGGVCLNADACEKSEDPVLIDYAQFSTFSKTMKADIVMLRDGTSRPIHCSFGLVATGRTSCSKPNLQNLRRMPGIRESFRPRPGYVYAQADYPQLELFTLAEACSRIVGYSRLGEAISKKLDAHTALAASILGVSYEHAIANKGTHEVKDARQTAKVANFGFPGGLGPASLVNFAWATYKVKLDEKKARELREQWLRQWPEMVEYFGHVAGLKTHDGATITQLVSGRKRAGCSFTAACNSYFQGLGADIAKLSVYETQRRCYTHVPGSSMYGARLVNFIHDEIIVETPEDGTESHVAQELADVMAWAAGQYLERVTMGRDRLEPTLMRIWSKDACDLYYENGLLAPWDPSDWLVFTDKEKTLHPQAPRLFDAKGKEYARGT